MTSSLMKMIRNVFAVLGIVGSASAGMIFQIRVPLSEYSSYTRPMFNWPLMVWMLIGVAVTFVYFTIIASVMENQESVIYYLRQIDSHLSKDDRKR